MDNLSEATGRGPIVTKFGKMLCALVLDSGGGLRDHFVPSGETINSADEVEEDVVTVNIK